MAQVHFEVLFPLFLFVYSFIVPILLFTLDIYSIIRLYSLFWAWTKIATQWHTI